MKVSLLFVAISCVFVSSLLVSNLTGVKIIDLHGCLLPAGALIFPFSYIFSNIITEVYGYAYCRFVLWLSFICYLCMGAYVLLVVHLPAADFWPAQAAYASVLGPVPRIFCASIAAFMASEFANAYVLARLKVRQQGHGLFWRCTLSTFVAVVVDSLVFLPIAYGANLINYHNWLRLAITLVVWKLSYEILAFPITKQVIAYIKQQEQLDYFDHHTAFNPFSLSLHHQVQNQKIPLH